MLLAEAANPGAPAEQKLTEAVTAAEQGHDALKDPAKLHGIDQLMQGLALAVKEDAETELQKVAYYATKAAEKPAPKLTPVTATEAA
jgi:hypothetical protein